MSRSMDESRDQRMLDVPEEHLSINAMDFVPNSSHSTDPMLERILTEILNLPTKIRNNQGPTQRVRSGSVSHGGYREHTSNITGGGLSKLFSREQPDSTAIEQLKRKHRDELQAIRERLREHHDLELKNALQINGGLEQQLKDSQDQLRIIGQENTELRSSNYNLQSQANKFRDIIINKVNSATDSVSDSTICDSFIDLRSQIQAIVRKFYRMSKLSGETVQEHILLAKLLDTKAPDAQIKNRARGLMFDFIYQLVLSQSCFGVDKLDEFGVIEKGLIGFERALSSKVEGHAEEIADWRACTMQCARWLQASNKHSKLQQLLESFMAPLVATDLDKASEKTRDKELSERLWKLSEDAIKFQLLLRSFKDSYKCELPGAILSYEEAEPQDSLGKDGSMKEGAKVAYTLFGMLVKYPLYEPNQRIILEKAQVVVD